MTFCFFSLFSDFWSTAILHISSGLKTASWLFKKRRRKKEIWKQQQKNKSWLREPGHIPSYSSI